jgi:hypothetical protein
MPALGDERQGLPMPTIGLATGHAPGRLAPRVHRQDIRRTVPVHRCPRAGPLTLPCRSGTVTSGALALSCLLDIPAPLTGGWRTSLVAVVALAVTAEAA